MYVVGKTGMGKSTLLENMAIQDIRNGEGVVFIDPHGQTAELLLDYVPEERMKDVLYFAPFDTDFPISFNVMEDVGPDKRHLVANGLMSTFEKIWVDAWSARMAYILNNTLLALLEYPGSTLLGINRMLSDKEYRKLVVENISDPSVRSFWVDEFAKYTDRYAQEATPAIQNKVGQFTSNPLVRNIIGQPKSTFDIRKMMDEKKIIIVNLSKGRVGEGNASLLGAMLITKIYLAAMSRADVSAAALGALPHFYLYVDEFQSFANKSFADILSEARKYKLDLIITHQYIEQMEEEVRAAVFGNVGTMVTFRVGAYDAEVLEKEFAPQFTAEDLVNLGVYQVYLKLMIDGVGSAPFSATTLPPIERPIISFREKIIALSRATFARPRAVVEEEIKNWHQPIRLPEKERPKKESVPPAPPFPAAPAVPAARVSAVAPVAPAAPPSRPVPAPPAPSAARENALLKRGQREEEPFPRRAGAPRPPIGLAELKEPAPEKRKIAQEENLAELRKALSSILGGAPPRGEGSQGNAAPPLRPAAALSGKAGVSGKEERSAERVSVPRPAASAEPPKRSPPADAAKEVPEDVLRRVLLVDAEEPK